MPTVRNKAGLEKVFVDNFKELSVNVDDLETLQTTTNTKLDTINTTQTTLSAKLPSALTGGGNLKVCIQELGNEGSERLNVDIGDTVSSKLPTALTGSGNLKVSIQETFGVGLATESLQGGGLPAALDSGNLKVAIQSGAAPAITGFSTATLQGGGLPAALDSGNLKVAIQSGAAPAITGFSTATLQGGGLPAALDSGSLKVAIQSGATPAITGFSTETTMSAMNAKISKGEATSVTAGTGGLQQTLLYGRHSNGDLRALECLGNRLITTDLVFGAAGPNEPTALARIAIHGQVNATNTYKNLRVSTDGVLSTDKVLKSAEAQTNTTMNIALNSEGSLEINTTGYSKVRISGVSSTTDPLLLMGSTTSGGVLMAFDSLIPVATVYDSTGGIQNIFSKLIECPPTFIKIRNPMSYTIAILASNVKMIV